MVLLYHSSTLPACAPDGQVLGLMIGSGLIGFYLAFLAGKTGTIWRTNIAHAIGGFIMIV